MQSVQNFHGFRPFFELLFLLNNRGLGLGTKHQCVHIFDSRLNSPFITAFIIAFPFLLLKLRVSKQIPHFSIKTLIARIAANLQNLILLKINFRKLRLAT
jgi:hypothetical protein